MLTGNVPQSLKDAALACAEANMASFDAEVKFLEELDAFYKEVNYTSELLMARMRATAYRYVVDLTTRMARPTPEAPEAPQ